MSPLLQHPRLHAPSVRATACIVFAPLLMPLAAHASDGDIVLPLYTLPAAAHAPGERAPDLSASSGSHAPAGGSESVKTVRPTSSFALVEMPPEASMPGSGYKRPHHAIGYRWQAAESWMRDHGFDAQTCYLPMVRLHTKLGQGGASGTLWLYGRCTFR